MDKSDELQAIRKTLKEQLVEQLSLEDVEPEDIGDDMPLFGEGLALDSLDAVEIIVLLKRNFNVEVEDAQQSREIFRTVNTLADYIWKHKDA